MENRELEHLLHLYERDELDDEQRQRLSELLATPEGRLQALRGGAPEALFLAHETESRGWDGFWSNLSKRMDSHRQVLPAKIPWFRIAAAAAVIVVVAVVLVIEMSPKAPPAGETAAPPTATAAGLEERTFTLRHRLSAEVLAELRPLMSDDAELRVPEGSRELVISDKPGNLDNIARALEQLDAPPATFKLRLRMLYALDNDALGSIKRVGGIAKEALDLSRFRDGGEITIAPETGRRYRELLGGRYLVQCFAALNEDGSGIILREFSLYDQQTKEIVRRAGLEVSLDGGLAVATGKLSEQGEELVLQLTVAEER